MSGLGDLHANSHIAVGQTLLMAQVLLGYVMLGAMVTRFAILFSAGRPADSFLPDPDAWWRRTTRGLERLKRDPCMWPRSCLARLS